MGGIYTLGPQDGTVIRNNRFHDIAAIKYGGWGIYFDEGSTDILAEKNLVYRTTHGGLHQHYGKDNVFRNNIIAFGREWQVQRTRPEDHRSFTFQRNLVYWDTGTAVSGNWANFNADFDHNVYWAFGKRRDEIRRHGLGPLAGEGHGRRLASVPTRALSTRQHGELPAQGTPASAGRQDGFRAFRHDDVGPRRE